MSSAAAHEPASGTSLASARVADLFERHGRMVYGICRAMLRDVQEAEDAMQQAFLSAHRALLGGARVRDPGAWIATIARNECRSRITAGMRAPSSVDDDVLAEIPHGVDDVERRLQAREVRAALARLPERQREAIVLRYLYGLGYGEVATALGLSRPATEALLFRARRAMRGRLRHAAAVVLVVPLSVREELALALPGFDASAGESVAAAGIAGGVLAKLASAPAAAKLATATVAISTVGAVGVVESHRPAGSGSEPRVAAGLRGPIETPAREVVTGGSEAGQRGGTQREWGAAAGGRTGSSSGASRGGASEISLVRAEDTDEGSSGPSETPSRAGTDDEKGAGIGPVETSDPGSGEAGSGKTDSADDEVAEESSSESSEQYRRSGSGSDDAEHDESDSEGSSDSSGPGSGSGSDDGGDSSDSSDSSGSGSSDDPEVEHP